MLSLDLQQALMASGPGTCLVLEVNGEAAFVALERVAAVADLRGPRNIELREEAYLGPEGTTVRLRALFYVQPLLTLDSYLDPTQAGDLALLEKLTRQETLSFHFFAPGRFDKPILQKQIPWRPAQRAAAARILAQVRETLTANPGGSFAAAKAALQKRDELPPVQVLTSGEEQIYRMLEHPPVGPQATPSYTSPVGIGWGDPAGPQVDVFSLGGPIPHVPGALDLAGAAWQPAPDELLAKLSGGSKQWRGVVAALSEAERVVLRYAWPRAQDPLTGLRDLVEKERQEGKIVPWPIIAALYVALQARRAGLLVEQWGGVIAPLLVALGELPAGLSPVPPSKELEAQAQVWDGHPAALPDNPYARARFVWEAGKAAWALDETTAAKSLNPLATAAGVYLACSKWPWRVSVGPAGAIQPAEGTVSNAVVAWIFSRVLQTVPGGPVLDFLLPGRKVYPDGQAIIEEPVGVASGERPIPHPENPAFLRALAQETVQEAEENAIYGPHGPFRVPVPEGTLLQSWDIREIRAWIETEGIWAGLVVEGGRVATVLHWRPGKTLAAALMVPTWAEAVLELALAALWHDLKVGGPVVFRERGAAAPAPAVRVGSERSSPDTRPQPRRKQPRTLPQPRRRQPYPRSAWALGGQLYEWGTAEERELIRRRAGHVRGHPRYLSLYVSECQEAVLQAALLQAPREDWRERLVQARDRRDEEEAEWWEVLLNAAGDAQARRTERDQVEAVEAVLAGARRRLPSSRFQRWLQAGLRALEDAGRQGAEETLEQARQKVAALRQAARERAQREGAIPPVRGWTYVRGYVPDTTAEEELAPAQVVRLHGLRGLLLVQATLSSAEKA